MPCNYEHEPGNMMLLTICSTLLLPSTYCQQVVVLNVKGCNKNKTLKTKTKMAAKVVPAKVKVTSSNVANGGLKNNSFQGKTKKWKRKRLEESNEACGVSGKRK